MTELNEKEIINTLLTSLDEAVGYSADLYKITKIEEHKNVANQLKAMRWLSHKTATSKPLPKSELYMQMEKLEEFERNSEPKKSSIIME
jgi:hypothetical protein